MPPPLPPPPPSYPTSGGLASGRRAPKPPPVMAPHLLQQQQQQQYLSPPTSPRYHSSVMESPPVSPRRGSRSFAEFYGFSPPLSPHKETVYPATLTEMNANAAEEAMSNVLQQQQEQQQGPRVMPVEEGRNEDEFFLAPPNAPVSSADGIYDVTLTSQGANILVERHDGQFGSLSAGGFSPGFVESPIHFLAAAGLPSQPATEEEDDDEASAEWRREVRHHLAIDVASFAASIASDTETLTSQSLCSPPGYPGAPFATALPPLPPTCGMLETPAGPQSASSSSSDPSDIHDPSQQFDASQQQQQQQQPAMMPGFDGKARSCEWSPVGDLSPIEDVSPSVEEAEMLDMIQQQRMYARAADDASYDPDSPPPPPVSAQVVGHAGNGQERDDGDAESSTTLTSSPSTSTLKRCKNFDDISGLAERLQSLSGQAGEADVAARVAEWREEAGGASPERDGEESVGFLAKTASAISGFFRREESPLTVAESGQLGEVKESMPPLDVPKPPATPQPPPAASVSSSQASTAAHSPQQARRRLPEPPPDEEAATPVPPNRQTLQELKAVLQSKGASLMTRFGVTRQGSVEGAPPASPLRSEPGEKVRRRSEELLSSSSVAASDSRSISSMPIPSLSGNVDRGSDAGSQVGKRDEEDREVSSVSSACSTPESLRMSRRRLPQVPREEIQQQRNRPVNRRELEIVKARLSEKQRELEERECHSTHDLLSRRPRLPKQRSADGGYSVDLPPFRSSRATQNATLVNVRGLLVPRPVQELRQLINEELLRKTRDRRRYNDEFAEIRCLERRLDEVRMLEQHQMSQIQEKLADIKHTGSVLPLHLSAYAAPYRPPLPPSSDSWRHHHRFLSSSPSSSPGAHQKFMGTSSRVHRFEPIEENTPVFDLVNSSLPYTSMLPAEVASPYRKISRSTDQLRKPLPDAYSVLEASQSESGLTALALPRDLDMEVLRKEQRIAELEREIDLRKRQIEETIRLQEELNLFACEAMEQSTFPSRQPAAPAYYSTSPPANCLPYVSDLDVPLMAPMGPHPGPAGLPLHVSIPGPYDETLYSYPAPAYTLGGSSGRQPTAHPQMVYAPPPPGPENYSASEYLAHRSRLPDEFFIPFTGADFTLHQEPAVSPAVFYSHAPPPPPPPPPVMETVLPTFAKSQDSGVSMSDPQLTDGPPGPAPSDLQLSPILGSEADVRLVQQQQRLLGGTDEDFTKRSSSEGRHLASGDYRQGRGSSRNRRPVSGEYDNYNAEMSAPYQKGRKETHLLTPVSNAGSRTGQGNNGSGGGGNQASSGGGGDGGSGSGKPDVPRGYSFPTKRILLTRDPKERSMRGNGVGMHIVGGNIFPDGHLGALVKQIFPGGVAAHLRGEIKEGDEIVECNGICLMGQTYEEVQAVLLNPTDELELVVREAATQINQSSATYALNKPPQNGSLDRRTIKSIASSYDNIPAANDDLENLDMYAEQSSPSKQQRAQNKRSASIKRQRAQESDYPPSGQAANQGDAVAPQQQRKEENHVSMQVARPNENETKKPDGGARTDDGGGSMGEVQLSLTFDDYDQSLTVHVAKAKDLQPMDFNGLADPFVKIRLHPDLTENPENARQIKWMPKTLNPEWQSTVVFMNVPKKELKRRGLEVTVWDYDRLKTNDFMGQAILYLNNRKLLDGKLHWYPLYPLSLVDCNLMPSTTRTAKPRPARGEGKEDRHHAETTKAMDSLETDQFASAGCGVPRIKITESADKNRAAQENERNKLHFDRSLSSGSSPERSRYGLSRADTSESKSSNSSSVTTDFLTEEQREVVRRWLGPGQLLLINYAQRVDNVGVSGAGVPDESLVMAELFLVLRKLRDEDSLSVTVKQCRVANRLRSMGGGNGTGNGSAPIGTGGSSGVGSPSSGGPSGAGIPQGGEVYVKFYLMYGEHQLSKVMKKKTKAQTLSSACVDQLLNFQETFLFQTNLDGMLLQVTLWSAGRGLSTHRMLGEAVIYLDDIEAVEKASKKCVQGWYKLLRPEV